MTSNVDYGKRKLRHIRSILAVRFEAYRKQTEQLAGSGATKLYSSTTGFILRTNGQVERINQPI